MIATNIGTLVLHLEKIDVIELTVLLLSCFFQTNICDSQEIRCWCRFFYSVVFKTSSVVERLSTSASNFPVHTDIYLEGLLYFLNLTLLVLLSITDVHYNNICLLKASFLYSIRKIRNKHPLLMKKKAKFTFIPTYHICKILI